MGKPRVPLDPVADLKRRLARYRGAQVPKVRSVVRAWWSEHDFDKCPATVGKRIAIALIAAPRKGRAVMTDQRMVEHKLAGMLILGEQLGDQLRAGDLESFALLFADDHLEDAVVVDWFASKVLATLLARVAGRAEIARQLATWRDADTIWQRRAACLAFVKLAPDGDAAMHGFVELVLRICATVVWSHERGDQTAVATLLRELSRATPARVEAFFRKHAQLMSRECARHAVAKLPASQRQALLAHHKRATSLRR